MLAATESSVDSSACANLTVIVLPSGETFSKTPDFTVTAAASTELAANTVRTDPRLKRKARRAIRHPQLCNGRTVTDHRLRSNPGRNLTLPVTNYVGLRGGGQGEVIVRQGIVRGLGLLFVRRASHRRGGGFLRLRQGGRPQLGLLVAGRRDKFDQILAVGHIPDAN